MKVNKILKIITIIISIVMAILIMVLCIQIGVNQNSKNYFKENLYIGGINVKGLTKAAAEEKINSALKNKIDNLEIVINYKDKSWKFSSNDFVVSTQIHTIVDDAFKYSQLKVESQNKLNKITKQGVNFNLAFNKIFVNFKDRLNEIKQEVEVEPINSEVEFLPRTKELFKISKSQNGIKIDEDKLYSDIETQFKTTNKLNIQLKTIQVSPQILEDDFNDKLNLLGEFSTDLSTSKGGRKHNVSLALSKFNGKIILPQEKISFNEVTGPQTAETGYQSAIVIQNGEYVEGIGGGICQASTTLYNALILSGVEVDEVHKHTLPVGYVEMGLDAMVNEGTSDLIFKNISDCPIYIESYVENDRAYAKVYGKPIEEGVTFKRSVEYVRTIPHKGDRIVLDDRFQYSDKVQYKGEYFRLSYPKEGYEVKAYLEKYKDGNLISKEMIRHEIYEPKQGVLIEGIKEPESNENVQNNVSVIPPQMEVETMILINETNVED